MSDAQIETDFDYEGFARRLGEAMFPEKVTAFATRTGVPQGTLSKYLKGAGVGPRLDIVAAVAKGAGVTLDWLVWGRGEGPGANAGLVRIPRYDATLAAGCGSWNEGRRKIEDMPFTAEFVQSMIGRRSTAGLSVLEGRGDSMFPTIQDRGLIIVDEHDKRLSDDIFAFVLAGDARIKRFRRLTSGLQIISDNPRYGMEELRDDEVDGLQVIGRALLVIQPL
jgi:transcriptional regulator with XRE-family HTH domain